MRIYVSVVVALVLTLEFMLGCSRADSSKDPAPPKRARAPVGNVEPVAAQQKDPPKDPPKGKVARVRDQILYRNYLNQMGIAYQTILTNTGKPPQTQGELLKALDGVNEIKEVLDKGYIVFIYGVRPEQMAAGASNTILAYEPDADIRGLRLVLMGSGSVHEKNDVEFAKLPKAK